MLHLQLLKKFYIYAQNYETSSHIQFVQWGNLDYLDSPSILCSSKFFCKIAEVMQLPIFDIKQFVLVLF